MGRADALVDTFYGIDPLRASDASDVLASMPSHEAISALVPLDRGTPYVIEARAAVVPRIRRLAASLGSPIVGHLVEAIGRGPEDTKWLAHHYFAGLEWSTDTQEPLVEILTDRAPNLDACRHAIEALGCLGMPANCVAGVANFARTTCWEQGRLDRYAFEKLGPAAIRAIARSAGKASTRDDAHWILSQLSALVLLREEEFPKRYPSSYDFVQGVAEDFSVATFDYLMQIWGGHERLQFRQLAVDILAHVAPIRATDFLLEVIAKHDVSQLELSESAALALAEIVDEDPAGRVAKAYEQATQRRALLGLPLVMLFPVLGDRGGATVGVEAVLKRFPGAASYLEYALALRGDHRLKTSTIDHLNSSFSEQRWMAALSLGRLLKDEAHDPLRVRLDEAGDDVECAAFCAALIRSGDPGFADRFQSALQSALRSGRFRSLPTIWRLEVLEAFRSLRHFGGDAFGLWREAVGVMEVQQRRFEKLLEGVERQPSPPSDEVIRYMPARRWPEGEQPHHVYGKADALHDRLYDLATGGPKAKPVMFLLGSALTMPDGEGQHGVPGVQGVVDLVRSRLKGTEAERKMDELVDTADPDVYQKAFQLLGQSRGQDMVNDVVRTAVGKAMRDCPSNGPGRGQVEAEFYRGLEQCVSNWILPTAVDSFARMLSKWKNDRELVVLTTNFDPLIEVSLTKYKVEFDRTVLHGDGRPGDPVPGRKRVVHLHGHWYLSDTLHRPDQLDCGRRDLENWLARRFDSHVLVVIGYGGWDDVVTRVLQRVVEDYEGCPDVVWAFYDDDVARIEESYESVLRTLRCGNARVRGRVNLYRGVDCRCLFSALESKLG